MKTRLHSLRSACAWGLAVGAASISVASAETPDIAYEIGGIGLEEVARIKADRGRYALALLTAAQGSGAYLADVQVTVRSKSDGAVVFDRELDAPWLLLDLPPGRYDIAAQRGGQTQHVAITLAPGQHRDVVVYFHVAGLERREIAGP